MATPEAAAGAGGEDVAPPKMYVVVGGLAKKANVGTLVRSACAFGATELLVIGTKKVNYFGNHGTVRYLPARPFASFDDCKAWCVAQGIHVCGIEIVPEAESVIKAPFRGDTAFLVGEEGAGLTDKQRAICDHYVYIPHYGNGTASLNVSCAGSIVLQHFAVWGAFAEHKRSETLEKFEVLPIDVEKLKSSAVAEAKRAARAAKRAASGAVDGEAPPTKPRVEE